MSDSASASASNVLPTTSMPMSSFTRALERTKEVRETGVGSSVMVSPDEAMSLPVLNGLDSGLLVRASGSCDSQGMYAEYYHERMVKRNLLAKARIPNTVAFEREMAIDGGAYDAQAPRFPLGEINAALAADFPGGKLVAAGGLPGNWACGLEVSWKSDVDLFLIDPMAAKAPRSEYARRVLARAIQLVGDWAGARVNSVGDTPVETWVSQTMSAVTFAARLGSPVGAWRDIQVVLRAYPSVPALLSDFDHGGCAFAYVPGTIDGAVAAGVPGPILAKMSNFEMSHLGSLAFQTGVIALEPEISRKTTLGRLVKYGNRGFDVFLPGAANFVSRREAIREIRDFHSFTIIPGLDGTKHSGFDQVATPDGVLLVNSFKKGYIPKDGAGASSDAGASSADFYYAYGAEKLTPHRPEQMFRTLAKELPRVGVEDGRYFTSCYFRLVGEKGTNGFQRGVWSAYCASLAEGRSAPGTAMEATRRAILKQYRKNLISAAKKLNRVSALTMLAGRDVDASAERIERLVKEAGAFLLDSGMWPRFRPRGSNLEEQLTARDDAGFDPASFYTREGFPFAYAPNEFDGTLPPELESAAEPADEPAAEPAAEPASPIPDWCLVDGDDPDNKNQHIKDRIAQILSEGGLAPESLGEEGSSIVRLFRLLMGRPSEPAESAEPAEPADGELTAEALGM